MRQAGRTLSPPMAAFPAKLLPGCLPGLREMAVRLQVWHPPEVTIVPGAVPLPGEGSFRGMTGGGLCHGFR